MGAEIYCLAPPKTILVGKFPCLLNLPPTNLEQSASSSVLSLPSVYRGQFANQQCNSIFMNVCAGHHADHVVGVLKTLRGN